MKWKTSCSKTDRAAVRSVAVRRREMKTDPAASRPAQAASAAFEAASASPVARMEPMKTAAAKVAAANDRVRVAIIRESEIQVDLPLAAAALAAADSVVVVDVPASAAVDLNRLVKTVANKMETVANEAVIDVRPLAADPAVDPVVDRAKIKTTNAADNPASAVVNRETRVVSPVRITIKVSLVRITTKVRAALQLVSLVVARVTPAPAPARTEAMPTLVLVFAPIQTKADLILAQERVPAQDLVQVTMVADQVRRVAVQAKAAQARVQVPVQVIEDPAQARVDQARPVSDEARVVLRVSEINAVQAAHRHSTVRQAEDQVSPIRCVRKSRAVLKVAVVRRVQAGAARVAAVQVRATEAAVQVRATEAAVRLVVAIHVGRASAANVVQVSVVRISVRALDLSVAPDSVLITGAVIAARVSDPRAVIKARVDRRVIARHMDDTTIIDEAAMMVAAVAITKVRIAVHLLVADSVAARVIASVVGQVMALAAVRVAASAVAQAEVHSAAAHLADQALLRSVVHLSVARRLAVHHSVGRAEKVALRADVRLLGDPEVLVAAANV